MESESPEYSDAYPDWGIVQPVRKQVTVLFCDVVDYTSRSVALDPEDLSDDIRVFQILCSGVAKQYHGHIANYLGDGILVLFGHPFASEFDSEHAVRAGMEMVVRIKRNNRSAQWRQRVPIRIRVGIATGLVVVGERAGNQRDQDEMVFGEAPNLAARLQSFAEPNSVVTTLRTRRLVGGAFKFRDLGEHHVKGFPQPINIWQILHESTFQNRSTTSLKRVTTKFVSRCQEMRCLQENYARALAGQCRIIHISGDPGIGKSRLLRAFEKTIYKPEMHRLRVTCSPYFRNTPFKPIVDETHRWLQIGAHDDLKTRQENIREAMIAIQLDGKDEHALFNELLGIPATPQQPYLDINSEEKHNRTVDALTSFVIRLSRLRPLLLVVEDLHWADPSTLEVLSGIVSRAGAEKLFAVFISRTGFVAPWPKVSSLVHMKISGLNTHASSRLIASIAGDHNLPTVVKQKIICKSDGVPLFLEETCHHLLEQMRTDEMRTDQIRDSASEEGEGANSFAIPDTLQDSLNARLERLGEAKAFAQLASVFGGNFRYSLISKVAGKNAINADVGMDALLEADVLSILPGQAEDRYQFRHTLFGDAAYHSLLKKTRQRYHLQIAELLEQDSFTNAPPELIAYHYSYTERIDRAVDLWLQAGEQAIAQSAIRESLRHLSAGLRLVNDLPRGEARRTRRLALLLNQGVAMTVHSGYRSEQVTTAYAEALALASGGKNYQQTAIALYGLWRCLVSRMKFSESMQVSMKLKLLSEKFRDRELMMTAYGLQGMTRMVTGRLVAAEGFYNKAMKLYDRHRQPHLGVRFGHAPYITICGFGAVNKLLLNKNAQSLTEIDQLVQSARAIGHPYTVAETLRIAAMYQQIAGDLKQLGALAEETVTLAKIYGFEGLLAAGNIFLGFCRVMRSGKVDAVHETHRMRRNLKRYRDNYGKLFLPYFYGVVAEACLFLQDYAGVMRAVGKGLSTAEQFGETWWRASLLGIKAQAATYGQLASRSEIDEWLRAGMEIAKAQHAELVLERLRAFAVQR